MATTYATGLDAVDLWTPVSREGLPDGLVQAMAIEDWRTVRSLLGSVMDGVTTDGGYGRALLQVALELPIGI
jgi:hypothetical protein